MQKFSLVDAIGNRKLNNGGVKYPDSEDPRCVNAMLFPNITPGFKLVEGQKIFTIGSCFARNIEKRLAKFDVPTRSFVPVEDDPSGKRNNTVLNEYNPGTMAQRINNAIAGTSDGEVCILPEGEGYSDYFITGAVEAPMNIVKERRNRIEGVYKSLASSDALIVTLGMTEAWYDLETERYLNRAPGKDYMKAARGAGSRFQMRILSVDDCLKLLAPSLENALNAGLKNILLTVSPVPLQRSFGQFDAVVGNMSSKSTLRVVADELTRSIPKIDYFPSYEMVTLFGGNPYVEDNVHVRDEVVARVTQYMVESYS